MGLRCLLFLVALETLTGHSEATSLRQRRQASHPFPAPEPKAYQPPIASSAAAPPPPLQNAYQPPISSMRASSGEYQSPLSPPQQYSANVARAFPSPSNAAQGPQAYVPPQSVQYVPPAALPSGGLQSFSVFQQPAAFPPPATSYSVQQQPPQAANQAFHSGLPQSTAERTYSTHSKVVGSHVPAQAIHKAPASEIQPDGRSSAAKEKDNKNDEYVVYYYYYYDNDTAANNNNNLSLNFDDIPSLEGYDHDRPGKEPEKSASARTLSANVNSLAPALPSKDSAPLGETSQPRSVGDAYKPDDALLQPLKPVSNVFRYGSNEVPRFPVLPNFVATEAPTTAPSTPDTLTTEAPTTQSAHLGPDPKTEADDDDDDLNSVLDHATDPKASDERVAEEPATTTTTTTTEPPTTTEEPTTTTEKPRRRPSLGGGRRRFNPSPSASFNSNRNRQTSGRSSTSTTSTTTTTTSTPPTRRSFQGNRIRPRPAIGSNRPRTGARTTEAADDTRSDSKPSESTTVSTTTTTSRSRFTSASPRRFQSSRSRAQTSSGSTPSSTTTRAPPPAVSRSRPTSRPRPNLISRNRPPRPGFPRPRPGSEPEETETTTTPPAPTEEEEEGRGGETSPETDELPSTRDEGHETDEDNETSAEETEEPATTEGNRFSALFRPRNRNALGNRPRPVIGNRPSRS